MFFEIFTNQAAAPSAWGCRLIFQMWDGDKYLIFVPCYGTIKHV